MINLTVNSTSNQSINVIDASTFSSQTINSSQTLPLSYSNYILSFHPNAAKTFQFQNIFDVIKTINSEWMFLFTFLFLILLLYAGYKMTKGWSI